MEGKPRFLQAANCGERYPGLGSATPQNPTPFYSSRSGICTRLCGEVGTGQPRHRPLPPQRELPQTCWPGPNPDQTRTKPTTNHQTNRKPRTGRAGTKMKQAKWTSPTPHHVVPSRLVGPTGTACGGLGEGDANPIPFLGGAPGMRNPPLLACLEGWSIDSLHFLDRSLVQTSTLGRHGCTQGGGLRRSGLGTYLAFYKSSPGQTSNTAALKSKAKLSQQKMNQVE